jgi:putative tricarboxylic transport membrane protein
MRINDTVFGAVLLALAASIWIAAAGFPKMPGTQYGPGFFPQVIAVGLGIGGLMLLWRGRQALLAGERIASIGPWARHPSRWLGLLVIVGSLLFYDQAADILGFPIVGLIIGIVFMAYLGVRLWRAAVISLGMVVVIWLLFARLLLVPLPGGPLTPYLW